ncbi:hypothetical protein LCGC14_3134320, partial [marine sediment metagenome]
IEFDGDYWHGYTKSKEELQKTKQGKNILKAVKKDELKRHKEEAKEYGDSTLGGHAYENLYNLLHLVEKKVDGVVHVMPLACMPEGTIETYINHICRENKIPLLRIHIDENSAEANLETRLETFCELLKIRKK